MKRLIVRSRIRKRGAAIPTPPGPQWSVGLSQSSIDEGESVNLTVSVNLNGYTPGAGEFAFITLTTMTAADFAAQFPGETQATSGNGDFPTGYTSAMKAAIEALGGTGVVTTVNGISAIVLGFRIDTFTSVQITRATSERPGDNGSRRLVHSILSATVGTILVDSDSCVINDVSIEPEQGDLASIELTNAYVSVMGPDVGPAADTEIGRFVFKDAEGNVLNPGADALVFATDGDVGGRFAIHDTGSGTDRYRLRHTAVVADFETVPGGVGTLGQFLNYVMTVQGTISGITVAQPLPIYKRYTAIAPTGDETANEFTYTTCDEFRTLINTPGSNRTIKPGVGVTGVLRKSNYTNDITIDDSNVTIEGSTETVLNHRKGIRITQCSNIKVLNQGWGVGTSDATSTAKKDIDNLEVYGAGGYVKDILFYKNWFIASNDELMRIKYSARRVLLQYCIFGYPFYPANHTKSVVHNHGPAASDRCGHIIADKCVIWGADTRMFQVQSVFGFVQVNCIMGFWKDNQAAIRFIGEDANGTARAADGQALANLFVPQINNSTYRGGAIEFLSQREALTWNYVPQSGDYANHFIKPSTDDFSDDPLTVANGAITIVDSDSPNVVRSTPNFEFEGITVMPTSTEQNRRDLFDHVLDNAGNGSLYCQDLIAEVRAGTATLRAGLAACSPAMFEAAYGGGTPPWSGGGTYGHGVV